MRNVALINQTNNDRRYPKAADQCPLLGEERTSQFEGVTSAFDPRRTTVGPCSEVYITRNTQVPCLFFQKPTDLHILDRDVTQSLLAPRNQYPGDCVILASNGTGSSATERSKRCLISTLTRLSKTMILMPIRPSRSYSSGSLRRSSCSHSSGYTFSHSQRTKLVHALSR